MHKLSYFGLFKLILDKFLLLLNTLQGIIISQRTLQVYVCIQVIRCIFSMSPIQTPLLYFEFLFLSYTIILIIINQQTS